MKCFYDPTQDAIGTCKSCGKGLSADYLTDMAKGLACRGHCEEDVRSLILLIDQNISGSKATKQILKRSSATSYGSSGFTLLLGVVFLAFGYRRPEIGFLFYLGLSFLIYGLWALFRAYRYASIIAEIPDADDRQMSGGKVEYPPNS